VPDGVLFGNSKAHKEIRRMLVEEQKLEAVISLPSGVFKPYAGVSTAILIFTKTNSGGTDSVWFYDMLADGWSLDDQRKPLLELEKLGATTKQKLTAEEHEKNNLPDVLARWQQRDGAERNNSKTAQSFTVDRASLIANDYDLSVNKYKEVVHEHVEHVAPLQLIAELKQLEIEIQAGLTELERMLK
jgi:type I restriction enzyme M protein